MMDRTDKTTENPIYYCDHGEEVPVDGGASSQCVIEDARDDDYGDW